MAAAGSRVLWLRHGEECRCLPSLRRPSTGHHPRRPAEETGAAPDGARSRTQDEGRHTRPFPPPGLVHGQVSTRRVLARPRAVGWGSREEQDRDDVRSILRVILRQPLLRPRNKHGVNFLPPGDKQTGVPLLQVWAGS